MILLLAVLFQDGESGIDFAARVQCKIADRIGLEKIDCDGYTLKYGPKRR